MARLGIVVGGIASIVGCPQVTSSQPGQTNAVAAVDDAAAVLTVAGGAETVITDICSVQSDWQRPNEDEQQKYVAADPRFAAAIEAEPLKTVADSFWQHEVLSFTTYGLSARMEPMLLSGLWSAADQVWASCYDADQATAINAGEVAETWLMGHRLVGVEWQQDRYVMVVAPASAGLQVVHFNRVEASTVLPLQVVDTAGNEIDVVSGDYE
ncbi:MAG: hypothetical protein AAFZ80_11400 [Cyanobacteria bacterium P01_A01_bin.105]